MEASRAERLSSPDSPDLPISLDSPGGVHVRVPCGKWFDDWTSVSRPWANAHRVPVEEDKPETERGAYLYPELFGASSDKGLNARLQH